MLTLDQLEIGRSYILKTTGIKETEAVRGIRNATRMRLAGKIE